MKAGSIWTFVRSFKFNSIFVKYLLIVFVMLLLPLLVIHYTVYTYNEGLMREEIGRASMSELTRIRDTVDLVLNEANHLGIRLASNEDLHVLLAEEEIDYRDNYAGVSRVRRLQELLKLSSATNPYVSSIQIYLEQSNYLLEEGGGGLLYKYDHAWWQEPYRTFGNDSREWYQSLLRPQEALADSLLEPAISHMRILPLNGTGRRGVIMIHMDFALLEPLLQRTSSEQQIFVADRSGHIIYAQQPEWVHQSIGQAITDVPWPDDLGSEARSYHEQTDDMIVSVMPSEHQDWLYISAVHLEQYEARRSGLNAFIGYLALLGGVLCLLFTFIVSIRIYQPIRSIMLLLQDGRGLLPNQDGSKDKPNELKYIANTIIRSNEREKELEKELHRRYELVTRAQSHALQSQINPHFLYNTLESLNWEVMRLTGGKNRASIMIHSLSRLFRISLSTGDSIIPVRTEVEHARLYLDIQQFRFQEQLEVIWKINESILSRHMVKLTLQPIIENAIQHGIGPGGEKLVLRITGYESGGTVWIKVKDNGRGMASSLADKLNQSFRSDDVKMGEHIGLSNVNQRIKLIFGTEYGLAVFTREEGGTIVEMRLPARG